LVATKVQPQMTTALNRRTRGSIGSGLARRWERRA
jgi:hypothetical protein